MADSRGEWRVRLTWLSATGTRPGFVHGPFRSQVRALRYAESAFRTTRGKASSAVRARIWKVKP